MNPDRRRPEHAELPARGDARHVRVPRLSSDQGVKEFLMPEQLALLRGSGLSMVCAAKWGRTTKTRSPRRLKRCFTSKHNGFKVRNDTKPQTNHGVTVCSVVLHRLPVRGSRSRRATWRSLRRRTGSTPRPPPRRTASACATSSTRGRSARCGISCAQELRNATGNLDAKRRQAIDIDSSRI